MEMPSRTIRLTKTASYRYIYPIDMAATASDTNMSVALTSKYPVEGAIDYINNRPPVW